MSKILYKVAGDDDIQDPGFRRHMRELRAGAHNIVPQTPPNYTPPAPITRRVNPLTPTVADFAEVAAPVVKKTFDTVVGGYINGETGGGDVVGNLETRIGDAITRKTEAAADSFAKRTEEKIGEMFTKYSPQLKMMGGGLAALLGVYLLSRLFRNRGGGGGGGSNVNVYANAPAQNAPTRRWNSGNLFRG